jgi:acetylornithine deacetylase/succinyl-diaminopimelate desuccinylase-like protein
MVPGVDMEAFNLKLGTLLAQLTAEKACSFSHEIIHSIPSLSTEAKEPLIQSLLNWSSEIADVPSEPIGLSYGTDAAALIPPKNIPFAIFGGGSASIIHQANEYVPLEELIQAAQIITAALVENYSKK